MGDYDFILDGTRWSYSRIESFVRCPCCFFLTYILKKEGSQGAFGQYGNYGHELLEKYFKNELFSFELEDEYTNNYTKFVTSYFPPIRGGGDLATNYYEQGKEYFHSFNGLSDEYEVLGVESEYEYKIDKYDFKGIVDLELKNKNGWLEIVDHKSKSKQHITRITKKSGDMVQLVDKRYIPFDLCIQLYLYCVPFFEKYGEYPKYINFNMFRIQDWYKLEFNKDDFEKSKKWVVDSIERIYKEVNWSKGDDLSDFWCSWTCSVNSHCKFSQRYIDLEGV